MNNRPIVVKIERTTITMYRTETTGVVRVRYKSHTGGSRRTNLTAAHALEQTEQVSTERRDV